MWLILLLAQEHAEEGPGRNPLHAGDPTHWEAGAWAWGIFLVLVLLLWKFAWGPITKGLEARAQRISESLKKAEEIEKAARELQETNRQLLARAQQEAQGIVAEARAAATSAADEVLQKAHQEIDAQRQRYVREMQLTVDKARADLRRDTVNLTIDAAAKLLGRTMTDADSRRLAAEALADAENAARN